MQELSSAVVLVTGAMASGKSSVAQLLAERLPRSVHLRGDSFRRMIVSGREEFTPPPIVGATAQLPLRYQASAAVADLYAQADGPSSSKTSFSASTWTPTLMP